MYISTIHKMESMKMLKESGIDGIIIGIPQFSIRHCIEVSFDQISEWKEQCTKWNLKLYINCLKFIHEQELDLLEETMELCKKVDVDGIYYADEGVLYCAKALGIEDKLIYQPETLITSSNDALFYLQQGCQSVSLAHELSIEEIKTIAKQTNKIEILIHGYYSTLYSRRPLIKNYFDAISKEVEVNKPYTIIESTRKDKMPIVQDPSGTTIYSEHPMNSQSQMPVFMELGIDRFRIDSIFFDDEWTCEVIQKYISGEKIEDDSSDGWYYQESITKKGA